jgi:hypothetical protein
METTIFSRTLNKRKCAYENAWFTRNVQGNHKFPWNHLEKSLFMRHIFLNYIKIYL